VPNNSLLYTVLATKS